MTTLRYARTGITTDVSADEVDVLVAAGWSTVAKEEPDTAPSEEWTVAQLTKYAARHDVDVTGLTVKADILAAVAG